MKENQQGQRGTLHNKERVKAFISSNDSNCVCTKQQSLKMNGAKTNRAES